MSPKYRSLQAIQAAIANRQTNCSILVEHYLGKIAASGHLNAYVEVFTEEAIARARELDEKYRTDPSSVGRLFGMVVSIKDVICYRGHQVNAASKMLEGFESLYSATVVERLLAEDAIIIGRVNCDEFAMGSTTENSAHGPTRNAADPERVPGGSSGGSAVAIQTDTCLISIGSDTGGSVRQPAAFCGVTGFKPTYGRISRHGLIAYASSFDQIGILGHSPEDIALVLSVIAGPDEYDATALPDPPPAFSFSSQKEGKPEPKRIAFIEETLTHPGLDPAIRQMTVDYLKSLEAEGHQLVPVHFFYLDFLIPAYYVLTTAEASTNLSRYDGVRFGHRSEQAGNVEEVFKLSRTEGFGTEVKRRIMLGTFVLSAGFYDAYYAKAQKARRLIAQRVEEILKDCDLLAMPATPEVAPKLGELTADPVKMYLSDIYTVLANLCGIPAISILIGKHPEGLPVGIQFMAGKGKDVELLIFTEEFLSADRQGGTELNPQ